MSPFDENSGPHTAPGFTSAANVITEKTGLSVGLVITLVVLAVSIAVNIVRSEARADWAQSEIVSLKSWRETETAAHNTDALRLQRIEDSLRRIETRLDRHGEH